MPLLNLGKLGGTVISLIVSLFAVVIAEGSNFLRYTMEMRKRDAWINRRRLYVVVFVLLIVAAFTGNQLWLALALVGVVLAEIFALLASGFVTPVAVVIRWIADVVIIFNILRALGLIR